MVRNDEFFLRKWVEYYGRELGTENLYIYLDGKDQRIPSFCEGVNVTLCDKIGGKIVLMEKRRLRFLSEMAAGLLERYDLVIGVDADEFLIPDPALGLSLAEFLSDKKIKTSISGLGIDMGQNMNCEKEIDPALPFLSQRRYGVLGTRYTKPSVIAKPLRWGSGFHRIKGHDFHIAKDLYLFHFGYFDYNRIQARFSDEDRKAAGCTKHIAKRMRTINYVTDLPVKEWNSWTGKARIIQQLVRPPYAINKPAMFGLHIVVGVPDRFSPII